MYQLDLFEDSYFPSPITLSYKPSEAQQQMLRSSYMPKHFSFPLYEAAAEMPSALMAYCWLENITAKEHYKVVREELAVYLKQFNSDLTNNPPNFEPMVRAFKHSKSKLLRCIEYLYSSGRLDYSKPESLAFLCHTKVKYPSRMRTIWYPYNNGTLHLAFGQYRTLVDGWHIESEVDIFENHPQLPEDAFGKHAFLNGNLMVQQPSLFFPIVEVVEDDL